VRAVKTECVEIAKKLKAREQEISAKEER